MEHKNLAVELLKKLLNDEIRSRKRKNVIEARSFAEMLEKSLIKPSKSPILGQKKSKIFSCIITKTLML
jgi:hypothetical protein